MKHLAEKYHAGAFRKGDGHIPYFAHPQAVVRQLLEWGEKEDSPAISIAWGHDLLEETAVTEAEILAVSNETVLAGIKLLTRPDGMEKSDYLQRVAGRGSREVLLVKTADRICNTRDFVAIKRACYAYRYLLAARCLLPALERFATDPVVEAALAAWHALAGSLPSAARHDAVRGCLLGGAVGDALGAPVKFPDRETVLRRCGDGTGGMTDDMQMTLFLAEDLLQATGEENRDPAELMNPVRQRRLKPRVNEVDPSCRNLDNGLVREKRPGCRSAPGMSCLRAQEDNVSSFRSCHHSNARGTVMRMTPVGLLLEPEAAYEYGCRLSAIAQGHSTGISAGGAFAMLIAYLLPGASLEEALARVELHLRKRDEARETLAALRAAEKAGRITELGGGRGAEEALAIGVCCARKHPRKFAEGVLEAVNISGGGSSAGAITGSILGVLNGEESIPEPWRRNLRGFDIVSRIADELYRKKEAGVR